MVIEALLASAVLIGGLWLVIRFDVAPGPREAIPSFPPGLAMVSVLCAVLVLTPAVVAAAARLLGRHPASRLAAAVTAAMLIATSGEWGGVPRAHVMTGVSLVTGAALIACTHPRFWVNGTSVGFRVPRAVRPILAVVLLTVLYVAGSTAWFGWTLGVVNLPEEGESGWPYLAWGLAVSTGCATVGRLLPRTWRPTGTRAGSPDGSRPANVPGRGDPAG